MNNYWKITVGLGTVLVVGAIGVWLEATPVESGPRSLETGTLAHAVATECDPTKRGDFRSEKALGQAITCRDLAAQESMALSTRRLVWLSWAQIFIAIGGSVAVIWTVLVALRSMELTRQTFLHQQTATRLELRPRLKRNPLKVTNTKAGGMNIEFVATTVGTLSALNFRHGISYIVTPFGNGESALPKDEPRLRRTTTNIAPNSPVGMRIKLNASDAAKLVAGTHAIQIAYASTFDCELGGKYRWTFAKEFSGHDLTHDRMIKGFRFTEPALKGRAV